MSDVEVQVGLAGVPHYFYGMIAFACVFLVKAATKHNVQLYIDQQEIRLLIERLSDQLSATQVGRGHVIHRMAGGLRKMVESLHSKGKQQSVSAKLDEHGSESQNVNYSAIPTTVPTPLDTNASFNQLTALDGRDVGLGDYSALGFGMPFFDFEGTNLDMSSPMFSFPA